MRVWSYGLTTVAQRRDDGLLHQTLASLHDAGFPKPTLFIDGPDDGKWGRCAFNRKVFRGETIRTFGNWSLALWELLCREPAAHFYALFQDDLVAVKGLREYFEATVDPHIRAYYNLYTFPCNEVLAKRPGWFSSNQLGKGAPGLVLPREAVFALFSTASFARKPADPGRGWRTVDGAVLEALVNQRPDAPFTEHCHYPSLLQHTGGSASSMIVPENGDQPKTWDGSELSRSFPGEVDIAEVMRGTANRQ